jgi:hypothetical protein
MNKDDNYFRTLNVLFVALIAGLGMFLALTYWMIGKGDFPIMNDPETNYILSTIGILVAIVAIPLAFYLFRQRGENSKRYSDRSDKKEIYRSAIITKLALMEMAGLTNVVMYMISGEKQGLLLSIMIIIVMLISKPGESQFMNDF